MPGMASFALNCAFRDAGKVFSWFLAGDVLRAGSVSDGQAAVAYASGS